MTDHAFRVRDLSSILAQYDGSVPTHRKGAESSAVASASIRHVSAVGDLEPGRRLGAGGGLKAATPPAAGRRSSRAPGGSGLGEPHERRASSVVPPASVFPKVMSSARRRTLLAGLSIGGDPPPAAGAEEGAALQRHHGAADRRISRVASGFAPSASSAAAGSESGGTDARRQSRGVQPSPRADGGVGAGGAGGGGGGGVSGGSGGTQQHEHGTTRRKVAAKEPTRFEKSVLASLAATASDRPQALQHIFANFALTDYEQHEAADGATSAGSSDQRCVELRASLPAAWASIPSLRKVIRVTESTLPGPHRLRTAVCCDILNRLLSLPGLRFKHTEQLRRELFSSVYSDFTAALDDSRISELRVPDFLAFRPYFEISRDLQFKLNALVTDRLRMERSSLLARKMGLSNRRAINRIATQWHSSIKRTFFVAWAAYVRLKARSGATLGRFMMSQKAINTSTVFYAWLDVVVKNRNATVEKDTEHAGTSLSVLEAELAAALEAESAALAELEETKSTQVALSSRLISLNAAIELQKVPATRAVIASALSLATILGDAATELACLMGDDLAALPDARKLTHERYGLNARYIKEEKEVVAEEDLVASLLAQTHNPSYGIRFDDVKQLAFNELLTLSPELYLMRWVKYHLDHEVNSRTGDAYSRSVENFTLDLRDGINLGVLLKQIAPEVCREKLKSEADPGRRCGIVVTRASRLAKPANSFTTASHLLGSDAMANAAFMSRLAVSNSHIAPVRSSPPARVSAKMLDMRGAWAEELRRNLGRIVALPEYVAAELARRATSVTGDDAVATGKRGKRADLPTAAPPPSFASLNVPALVCSWVADLHAFVDALVPHTSNTLVFLDDARVGAALFYQLAASCEAFTWQLFTGKMERVELPLTDARYARDEELFTSAIAELEDDLMLTLERYWLPPPGPQRALELQRVQEVIAAEVEAVNTALPGRFMDLRRIFYFYAKNKNTMRMTLDEYLVLLRDCFLLSPPDEAPAGAAGAGAQVRAPAFPRGSLEWIFAFSALDENRPVVSPEQFIACLVRISVLKYKSIVPACARCFELLMRDDVLPNAGRRTSDGFRAELSMDAVQAVFQRYDVRLRRLFRIYALSAQPVAAAAADAADVDDDEDSEESIDQQCFLRIMMDCKIVTRPTDAKRDFPPEECARVFKNVQMEEQEEGAADVGGGEDGMIYMEFLEAIAAISHYKIPDPYIPFEARLEAFLGEMFIPAFEAVQRGKKR